MVTKGFFKFNGEGQNKLELTRDFIGSQPVFYYSNSDGLVYSDNLNDLLQYDFVPREIDTDALAQYMQLTYIPGPKTIFKNVCSLMPATKMTVYDNGKIETEKYWSLPYDASSLIEDYDECKRLVRSAVTESAKQKTEGDQTVGALLSGGFDSSIMVGILSQLLGKKIESFTVGFDDKEYDERRLAEIVAKRNNTNHRVLHLTGSDILANLDEILNVIDQPYADSSLLAAAIISKKAKEYVPYVVTGDLGDELFAGYEKYLIGYYSDMYNSMPGIAKGSIAAVTHNLLPKGSNIYRKANKLINVAEKDIFTQRREMMYLGFKDEELELLFRDPVKPDMSYIREQYDELKDADELTRAQYVDLNTLLEGDMFPKLTYAYRFSGLETRAPLCTQEIVELVYRIPSQYKISGKDKKIVFKESFKDLLPKELFSAPKHGFAVPVGTWLANELYPALLEYSSEEFINKQNLFNAEYIQKLIAEHKNGTQNHSSKLWAFFVFQHWYINTILSD